MLNFVKYINLSLLIIGLYKLNNIQNNLREINFNGDYIINQLDLLIYGDNDADDNDAGDNGTGDNGMDDNGTGDNELNDTSKVNDNIIKKYFKIWITYLEQQKEPGDLRLTPITDNDTSNDTDNDTDNGTDTSNGTDNDTDTSNATGDATNNDTDNDTENDIDNVTDNDIDNITDSDINNIRDKPASPGEENSKRQKENRYFNFI